jgi:hypothetical protein
MEAWQQEGTIGFFLPEPQDGWRTDKRRHDLPTLRVDRFRVTLTKSEEQVLSVEVHNLLEVPVLHQAHLPDGRAPLHVLILWRAGHAQLHFDARPVALVKFPDIDNARRATNN